MVLQWFSGVLLAVFGVNKTVDYVFRPILMLALICLVNAGVKMTLGNLNGKDLLVDTGLTLLVALPFVFICFTLLLYQAREHESLSNDARTDELTGLPNRRAFFKRTKDALRKRREGYFLIIDADHFKRINDTLGHPSGDICLQAVADRIRGLLKETDLIGRIGGEEFGVFLFDRTQEDLQRFAGRLCFPISVNIQGQSELLRITLSAGATEIGPDDVIQSVTSRADEALIAAKNNGRERMVLWRTTEQAA